MSYNRISLRVATVNAVPSGVQAKSAIESTCHSANPESRSALFKFIGANNGGNAVSCRANRNGVEVKVGAGVADGVKVTGAGKVGVIVTVGEDVKVGVNLDWGVEEPSFINIDGKQAVRLNNKTAEIILL
jgi:hypothetical protein